MTSKVVVGLLLFLSLAGCLSVKAGQESNLLGTQLLYQDFCGLSGVRHSTSQAELWSAETVHFQIKQLLQHPKIKNSVWSAYPVAYLRMTAARDRERCHGVLRSDNVFHARVNDLLSDLMTRFYVAQVDECADSDAQLVTNAGFCNLMAQMRDEQFDSLSAAMASTGLYISSHITLALVAIIYADDFWASSPFTETHRDHGAWSEIVARRVERLRSFKALFDRFNGFLADNIVTVAQALGDAQLLNGDVLRFVAGVGRFVPFKSLMFGRIRDDAFALALELAHEMDPATHPMMIERHGRYQINYGAPRMNFIYPEKLLQLEQSGIDFAANRDNMLIYRTVLGGRSWEEVTGSAP